MHKTVEKNDSPASPNTVKENLGILELTPKSEELQRKILCQKTLRRIKNNEASKVTRAKRKNAHKDLIATEQKLLIRNAELKVKVQVLEKQAEIIRELLIRAMNNRVLIEVPSKSER